ncbi:MAG: hypothetical protein HC846_13300 [Blastocatellia bacterium]|nr:hypothetical protein [Blastocatellia bacterium]
MQKTATQENTIFVYDGFGKMVAEYTVSAAQQQAPQTSYLTEDHLGSPRVITDQAGNVVSRHDYMAFGEEISRANYGTDSIRDKFTGYERDTESSLDYAQARYYNSRNGRFTSVDPLTASASIKNPQTFNRYSYGLNSPYKFTDPLGLAPQGVCMDLSCSNQSAEEADYMQRLQNTYDEVKAKELLAKGDSNAFWDFMKEHDSLTAFDKNGNQLSDPREVTVEATVNPPDDGIQIIIWDGVNDFTTSYFGHVSAIIDGVSWSFDSSGFHDQKPDDYISERSQISSGRGYVLDFGSSDINAKFKDAYLKAYDSIVFGKKNSIYDPVNNSCATAFKVAINAIRGDLNKVRAYHGQSPIPINWNIKPASQENFIRSYLRKDYGKGWNIYPKSSKVPPFPN